MTLEFSTSGLAPESDDYMNVIVLALRALRHPRDAVNLDGVIIDFRWPGADPQQYDPYCPVGIGISSIGDPRAVRISWTHPKGVELPWGLNPADLYERPYILLNPGDRIEVRKVNARGMADAAQQVRRPQKVNATIDVIRENGDIDHNFPRLTFVNWLYQDDEGRVALPGVSFMAERVRSLVDLVNSSDVTTSRPLFAAVREANHLLSSVYALTKEIDEDFTKLLPKGSPRLFDSLRRIENAASAFGYCLARAEAESESGPMRRAKSRGNRKGGVKRGDAKAAEAAVWKKAALKYAVKVDRPSLSRGGLATEIIALLSQMTLPLSPSLKAVEDWLMKEAERPKGPIRSRRRRARKLD